MWLQTWINEYVDANPAMSSEAQKARKPLAAAKVEVFAERGKSRLLQRAVLPAAAFPARGHGRWTEPGVAAATGRPTPNRRVLTARISHDISRQSHTVRRTSMAVDMFSQA